MNIETIYKIITIASPIAFAVAFFAFMGFLIEAFTGGEISPFIFIAVAIIAAVIFVVTMITGVVFTNKYTTYSTEEAEMVIVDIDYPEKRVELRFPETNDCIALKINDDTPLIDTGDIVIVEISKKHNSLNNEEYIIEFDSKIISVK